MVARNTLQAPDRRSALNNLTLVAAICEFSSQLREVRRMHVHSFGALIPHVFMGSVLAHVGRCLFENGGRDPLRHSAEVTSILEALERGMAGGDRETRNVISISFVRDAELEPFFALLRPHLGPKMRVELRGR